MPRQTPFLPAAARAVLLAFAAGLAVVAASHGAGAGEPTGPVVITGSTTPPVPPAAPSSQPGLQDGSDLAAGGMWDDVPFTVQVVDGRPRVLIEVGHGMRIPQTGGAEAVFVADSDIADVKTSPGEAVFLIAKSVGSTTLIATDQAGETIFDYDVVVIHTVRAMNEMLATRFPAQDVAVSSSKGSLLLDGKIDSQQTRADILTSLRASAPATVIVDRTVVSGSDLIRLDVRLLEINREGAARHGVDWGRLVSNNGFLMEDGMRGPGYRPTPADAVNDTLDALIERDVASVITQTQLSTVSGKEAQFEVGGQIPTPTFTDQPDDGNNFTLDYKFVGLNLVFAPVRTEPNKLMLKIASSISSTRPRAGS